MQVIYYTSFSDYLLCKKKLQDKIAALEELIDIMLVKQAEYALNKDINIAEYWLNDGQISIKTSYKTNYDVLNGIDMLEKLKNRYLNKLNGHQVVLRDSQAFRR